MKVYAYPADEFIDDFRSVSENRIAGVSGTDEVLLDLNAYLEQFIPDPDELEWKAARLYAAIEFIMRNIGAFADDGFVQLASDGAPAQIDEILIEAAHSFFAAEELCPDLNAVEITRLAKELATDESRD